MSEFIWQATEGAPRNYPMQIVSGSLHYHDGKGSLYVPDGVTLNNGWGKGRSSHVVGDDVKPLPSRLSITFFSYTENQFYSGEFNLPYEKILRLFQEGFYSPVNDDVVTYNQIIVGVAPGGAVSVWLWGYEMITEVFFGKAEKIDYEWDRFTNATHIKRDEYVRLEIEESLKTPERLQTLKTNGIPIGLWEHYHKARYVWEPLFTNMPILDKRITYINYFNGEREYLNYPLDSNKRDVTRAIPKEMAYVWDRPDAKPLRIKVFFDENEIFEAFSKVGRLNLPMQLEMRINIKNGKNDFTVWVKNEKEAIELKKLNVETYGIPERATQ